MGRCAILLAALALTGCGAREDDVAVVRAWADALRAGDVDAAADRFAIPAVVSNASPPVELVTRRAVRFFNETLPCGGEVIRTLAVGPYVAAEIRLTERPGGTCGSAAGTVARATFAVRDGRIVAWRRLEP